MSDPATPVLVPPRGGGGIGDYSLRDFAAKWLMQQDDLAETSRYRAKNAALATDRDGRDRVVLIGDSITEFWPAGFDGRSWRCINRGIAGQNSSQILLRFEDDAVALAPKLVVMLCGTNDLRAYAGPAASVAPSALRHIQRNITAMADICAGRSIGLALATIPPVGLQPEVHRDGAAIIAANRWLAAFARERALPVVDYHAALIDEHGRLPVALSDDGVHPNAVGYERMSAVLSAVLQAAGFAADTVTE